MRLYVSLMCFSKNVSLENFQHHKLRDQKCVQCEEQELLVPNAVSLYSTSPVSLFLFLKLQPQARLLSQMPCTSIDTLTHTQTQTLTSKSGCHVNQPSAKTVTGVCQSLRLQRGKVAPERHRTQSSG